MYFSLFTDCENTNVWIDDGCQSLPLMDDGSEYECRCSEIGYDISLGRIYIPLLSDFKSAV